MYGFSIVTRAASTRRPSTRGGFSKRNWSSESRPGDVHGEGRVLAASRAAPLLPDGGDASRVTAADDGVQSAHVHPQLQRVRRDDAEQVSAEEAALYLPSFPWGVAGAVGRDPTRPIDAEPVRGVAVDELRRLPGLGESDGPHTLRDEVGEDEGPLGQQAPPLPLLLVQQRRIAEDDSPLARGSAIVVHEAEGEARQALGELLGVGYRGAREDEPRVATVQPRHPPEPPEHRCDVRAEDAAQHVRLVDGHDLQIAKEVGPGLVVGQDADVQHVGVGEQDVRPAPDVGAKGVGRVPVIGRRMDAAQPEGFDLAELVLGQSLRRIKEDRAPARFVQSVLESGDLVAQRLPAGRRRSHHDVLTGPYPLVGLQLVRIQPRSAHLAQRLQELGLKLGQLHERRLPGRQTSNGIPERLHRPTTHPGQRTLVLCLSQGLPQAIGTNQKT